VKRGKWILDPDLLCDEPDPPPPGVEGLVTSRCLDGHHPERLEAHATIDLCKSCHSVIDPLGFGLEHYDGIGAYRTQENGFDVDATGQLPTGQKFDGVDEMAMLVANDPRFTRCLTKQVFTYALGRGVEEVDAPFLEQIEKDLPARGSSLARLIEAGRRRASRSACGR
jgi:hypothetical protein